MTAAFPLLSGVVLAGWRLDGTETSPVLMMMEPGADGTALHGGAVERYELGGALEGYVFKAGRPISGHLVAEILLADEGQGDGGVALVPGSHKSEVRFKPSASRAHGLASPFVALIVRRGCLPACGAQRAQVRRGLVSVRHGGDRKGWLRRPLPGVLPRKHLAFCRRLQLSVAIISAA